MHSARTTLLLASALALPSAVQAAPAHRYKVTVLVPFTPEQGSGVAMLINNRGLACGMAGGRGFCYDRGRLTELLPLPGDTITVPGGLNDKGQVVGVSYGLDRPRKAVIFVHGAARPLAVSSSHTDTGANDINQHGQIVGQFSDLVGEDFAYLSWRGNVRPLGSLGGPRPIGSAAGINDAGQIVGHVSQPGTPPEPGWTVGFLYQKGVMRALPTPPGYASVAVSINRHGQAVGFIDRHNGDLEDRRPVLWSKGVLKVLVDLPGDARGINRWGQVVGGVYSREGGFLYEPGKGARDLNELIDPASGFRIIYPQAINDRQQIVGYACKELLCGPVLLDPVRAPGLAQDGAHAAGPVMAEGE